MDISKQQLQQAVAQGVLSNEQAEALWALLAAGHEATPRFQFTHILYYLGGMIAIGAMTLFMNLGWASFGGGGLALISLLYAVASLACCRWMLQQRLAIPAGILATLAVCMTPLAVFGVQDMLGQWTTNTHYQDFHRYIDWRWLQMELATLAAGAIVLQRLRLPFLVMPVAVTLWYMSMDLAPMLFDPDYVTFDWREWVSLWFGLAMLLLAFWVDLRSRSGKDYAFWLYLFGTLAFWGGMSLMDSSSELNKFFYLCINLLMIFIGAVLARRVLAVFGGLGCAGYLGHLAYQVFRDSLLFPFVLTLIGLAVIWLGIQWQRREHTITDNLRARLPPELQAMLARRE
ncbi:DUF2157 domain-containing protein [Vogesella sp. LIG4]|uniref:DUF2157 domain-containing protein n=1 Tax=Vogesella sp. LIG4 TaxID=1192162 RepID=UPI00081FC557|nr:DUF2157 domain-containing protein [Vogesella sp. LIG4]SCK30888.1 hypothetical protein PSELUDRAFT_3846 [Vogesella sp. LIG4]